MGHSARASPHVGYDNRGAFVENIYECIESLRCMDIHLAGVRKEMRQ